MNEPQPLPLWIIPLFPLFFVGLWLFVVSLLAVTGGWRGLAARFPAPPDPPRWVADRFASVSADLINGASRAPVRYNRCVAMYLTDDGVYLRTWLIFRFMHPPLLIPWDAIEGCEEKRFFLSRAIIVHLRGTGTRIRLYGAPGLAVEEGWRRRGAGTAGTGPA
ncbi:hypothetical protein [Longimicrobium sp.]|uniref:hypothetical protein n=1 Tax=Longimicrobium sp. TaxID=2029185 RepID=UPI003B3AE273